MGGNNLDVKITADVTSLQQQFAVARAEAQSLSSEMNKLAKASAAGTLDMAGQSQFAQVATQYLQAKTAAAGYSAQIRENVEANKSFGDSIDEARGKMSTLFQVTGAAAAYEAVQKLVSIVVELGNRALDMRNMSDVLGVTTAQFQAMSAAADEAGISDQILVRANERLSTTLNEARDHSGPAIAKLKELGVTNEEIAQGSASLNDALGTIGARLRDGSTHAAEMAAATQLLGGRAALAAKAWEAYDGSAAGVAATNARLAALTDADTKALADNAIALKETATAAANVGSKLLLFAEDFTATGIKVAAAVGSLMTSAGEAKVAMSIIGQGGTSNSSAASAQIAQTQQVTQEVIVSAKRQTAATLQSEEDQVQAASSGSAQRVAIARKYYEDTRAFYNDDSTQEVRSAYREMISAGKEFDDARRAGLAQQLQDEKEKDAADTASYRESLAQMKEASKEFETIDRQNAAADISIARSTLEAKKSVLDSEVAASSQASAAKFASLRDLVNQEYALDQEALQNELKGLEDQPAAYNRVYNEIRELKAKNVQDLAALDQQAAEASRQSAQQDSASWRDSVKEIETVEGTLLSDLISKRRSLGASLVQVTASFAQQELANDIKAMTTKLLLASNEANSQKALEQGGLLFHIMSQSQLTEVTVTAQRMQTQAVIAGNQARTTATASAAATGSAVETASNAQTITGDAGKAFAGVFSGVSQIPYGWIIAPVLAAAAESEVMTHLDVGTGYVPQDMPAFLHRGEAVVPKPFADSMRQGEFGGGAEQGAGGDTHHHTWNVSAMDAQSFRDVIHSRGFQDEIAASMRKHFSRGGR